MRAGSAAKARTSAAEKPLESPRHRRVCARGAGHEEFVEQQRGRRRMDGAGSAGRLLGGQGRQWAHLVFRRGGRTDLYLAASIAAPAVDARAPLRLACGQTATDPGRPYSRVVLDLDATRVAGDRLLTYFTR